MTQFLVLLLALLPGQRFDRPSLGITVYADPDFRGRSATFREDTQDLRPFGLTDKATSLRVPAGEAWEVCEHINYDGRCRVFTSSIRDLRREGFNDIISSVRRVPMPGGDRGRGGEPGRGRGNERARLVLFDDRNYRGHEIVVTASSATLRGFSNRAGSLRVDGGEWEVCERPDFRGRCVVVRSDVPDLRRIGLNDQLSSARPVRR